MNLSIRQFRASLKHYLDRVAKGETFTLRKGTIIVKRAERQPEPGEER